MVIKLLLWLMTALIIIATLYLVFIYIISKSFRSYPCYLNITLSLIIAIDNLLRLIGIGEANTAKCYFQAFTLAFADKLIFTTLTVNAFVTYIGVVNYEFYAKWIKILFIVSNLIGLIIGITFATIFIVLEKPEPYENVCYVNGTDLKETVDTYTIFCLYLIYLFCNLKLLLYLVKIIKELFIEKKSKKNFSSHFYRILFSIIIVSLSFFVELLIINDSFFLNDDLIDLFYIIICLIVDLFYTFNKTVIKETYKIFCKKNNKKEGKKVDERDNNNESENEENNDNNKSDDYDDYEVL